MHGPRFAALTLLAALLLVPGIVQAQETPTAMSRPLSPVILAERPDIVQRFAVDADTVRDMVNRSLLKLTSANDLGTAWKRLGIVPDDVVGIKITTMGGPLLTTHRPIIVAICQGLQAAGLSPSHILIWDRMEDDMRRAGYPPTPLADNHVGITSVFPGTGFDPENFYQNALAGTLIWGDYDFRRSGDDLFRSARAAVSKDNVYGSSDNNDLLGPISAPQSSNRSYFARLVTRTCTKIINVPVLTDNSYVGINGCLASLALASVDNNRRFQGDPTYGDPAICEILGNDFFRRKVVINILDALVAQYAGGPRFNPQFTQPAGAIYVSRDPVAIDSLVLPRLEEWRKKGNIDPIGKAASHVHEAAYYNLGTDNPGRIQLLRLP